MDFYKSIAKYYDYIFPLKPAQVDFTLKVAKEIKAKSLLDIGCATGAFARKMGELVGEVYAFDLDSDMVEIAKSKNQNASVHFTDGNMLNIDDLYSGKMFDVVTCFGNTLVHLSSEELNKVFAIVKAHLNGVFLIQILNYDYVIGDSVGELPLIDNEVITFERFYKHESADKLQFETILHIKKDNIDIKNEISLFPLGNSKLDSALRAAGFSAINYYKNYNGDEIGGKHLPLIVTAK